MKKILTFNVLKIVSLCLFISTAKLTDNLLFEFIGYFIGLVLLDLAFEFKKEDKKMSSFDKSKENGLSVEQERKFNILRGVILGSFLTNPEKRELCEFITELEEYFNGELEDEE